MELDWHVVHAVEAGMLVHAENALQGCLHACLCNALCESLLNVNGNRSGSMIWLSLGAKSMLVHLHTFRTIVVTRLLSEVYRRGCMLRQRGSQRSVTQEPVKFCVRLHALWHHIHQMAPATG